MEPGKVIKVITGVLITATIFFISVSLSYYIKFLKVSAVTHITMLLLSIVIILILSKGNIKEYGFQTVKNIKWLPSILLALGLGALATLAMLVFKVSGIQSIKNLSFPEIILYVWFLASICEEILTRGFLQSYLSSLNSVNVNLIFLKVNLPTFIGALCFSLMHLIIVKGGASITTVIIILIFTFCVGLLAGYNRAKSGSIIPAIILHMLANVGGVVGGIFYAMIVFITTGHPPSM